MNCKIILLSFSSALDQNAHVLTPAIYTSEKNVKCTEKIYNFLKCMHVDNTNLNMWNNNEFKTEHQIVDKHLL